jgi:hypothetical protein
MKRASEPPGRNGATTILFASEERLGAKLVEHIVYSAGVEQDVKLINEKEIVSKHAHDTVSNYNIVRPTTSVVG